MRSYGTKTDAELMKLVSRADERAFEELYGRYEKSVYALVYYKLKNEADAADVTEEIFIRLWQKATAYSGRGSVGAFIMTVARNAATDRLRQRKDEVSLSVENGDGETVERDIPDTDETPEEKLLQAERVEAVRDAIDSLPEHQRETVILCDINGISYRDAAETLEVDIGTVKSRLSRARSAMREMLEEFYKNGNKSDGCAVNIYENAKKTKGGR